MNHIVKPARSWHIDWWRVSGGVYAVIAATNLVFAISMMAIPEKRAAVMLALASASNILIYVIALVMPIVELAVFALISFLFLKHNELAVKLSFIVCIFQGILKVVFGLKTGSVVHIIGGSFFAFISSFFIYMIKHHQSAHTSAPTIRHKKY